MNRVAAHILIAIFIATLYAPMASAKETIDLNTPSHREQLEEKGRALVASLSLIETDRLAAVRHNFGMISSVHLVRRNIENSIYACGKRNPKMKEEMDAGYKGWGDKIDPVLAQNQKKIKEVVSGKFFSKPDEVKNYLMAIDKFVAAKEDAIDKRPLSSKEDCKALLESLDKTGQKIAMLLGEVRWPDLSDKVSDLKKIVRKQNVIKPAGQGNE